MKGYPISSEGAGMIKQEMIEEICEKQATYLKGVQLEKEGAVRSLQCKDEGKKKVKVAAKVRGSGTTLYQVSGRINEDDSEIEGMSCSCPSSYSSDGICKHCVAVLMKYIQNRDTKVEHIKSAAGKAISPAKSTSYGLSRVINNYGRLEKLLYEQSDTCGKIFLEPSVSLRYGQFQVEFKLGNQKKYILKNTMMFFEALEHRERLSYGKGLEFYHTMEVFQPSSKKLVEFICREMEERRQNNPGLTGNYYSKTDNRYIRLHRGNMDGFMDAIEELQVTVDIENIEKSKWHLTKESYPLKMIIQGSPEGALIVTELLTYTYGWKYGYLWHEESIYRMNIEMIRDLKSFWDYRKDYQYNDCFISKSELPAFCKKMLPIIKKYYAIERREFNETSYLPPKAEYEFYLDTLDKYTVTCKIYAIYGDSRYNIYEKPKVIEQRDELEELKLAQQVKGWFHIVDPQHNQLVLTKDDEKLYLLLTDGMEQLQKLGTLYVSDALKSVQISSAPSVTVGVSLKGDLLELTLNSEEMPLAEMLEILKRYDRKKRFYRLKNGNFISMEEDGLCVVSEFGNHLSISGQQWDQGVITLPKFRALYLDHELKDRNGFHAIKNKEFKALIRDMKTIEDNDFEVPTSLEKVLREYQRQGFLWLKTLKSNGFGGVLADDMGLGKTLQVIAFLLSEWKQEKLIENQRFAVIVCPASLVYNWKSEIERFAPALAAITVTGTAVEREQIILNSPKEEILITSYDLLRRDMELYEQYQFQFEIIDEAQYIKNHNTKLAKSVKAIKAGFKTALTGTPIENRLSELWSIFDYLMPGFLYPYRQFREKLEIPIVTEHDKDALEQLQRLIRPFVLRRLKKDVLKDLPDKLEEAVFAKMEEEQESLYRAYVSKMKGVLESKSEEEVATHKIQILAELTRLRQLCCDPSLLYENYKEESGKMAVCMDLLRNAVDGGHRVLLFSQFTSMLFRIQNQMEKENIAYFSLTGSTKKEKRAELVERFQQEEVPVFCISLKAGGTGLNLTAADIVIHYDPWWNVAVQNQATDRAHRIGQKNVVTVYKLIAKNTIEESILRLQNKKKELAEQLLGKEGFEAVKFSKEDLLELLEERNDGENIR